MTTAKTASPTNESTRSAQYGASSLVRVTDHLQYDTRSISLWTRTDKGWVLVPDWAVEIVDAAWNATMDEREALYQFVASHSQEYDFSEACEDEDGFYSTTGTILVLPDGSVIGEDLEIPADHVLDAAFGEDYPVEPDLVGKLLRAELAGASR